MSNYQHFTRTHCRLKLVHEINCYIFYYEKKVGRIWGRIHWRISYIFDNATEISISNFSRRANIEFIVNLVPIHSHEIRGSMHCRSVTGYCLCEIVPLLNPLSICWFL
jgi:hypothetical protein